MEEDGVEQRRRRETRDDSRFHESGQTSGGRVGVPRGLLTVRKQ